ncbi:MAG: response regulator [Deltaproteobacteria bacterium]|nr:response regulator [Deltaproteobacteria bacterium]
MADIVLFVDDEANVLNSLRRLFADTGFEVLTASNALDALEILKSNSVSVIISDNCMPVMSGVELLQKARAVSPESVRIMLTAYADIQSAMDAINKGAVYKFISKPWNDNELKAIATEAVNKHNMTMSFKRADEATLLSLAQTVELKDPYTRGHCDRVAKYAVKMGEALGLSARILQHIKYASWLHDCGKIGVPEIILNHQGALSYEQMAVVKNHSQWGADVARCAQLSETVVNAILYHHEQFDGKGYPAGLKGDSIPVEARIITIADVYDALTSDRPYRVRIPHDKAMEFLVGFKGRLFDPLLAELFIKHFGGLSDG